MAVNIRNTTPVTEAQKQAFINSMLPDEGNLDPTHKVTLQFLTDSFAYSSNGKPKLNNEYRLFFTKEEMLRIGFKIDEPKIETTLGRIVFNYFSFSNPKIREAVGYINAPFDKGVKGKIEDRVALAFVEDEIDHNDMAEFIDRWNWLGFSIADFMSVSLDLDTVRPLKSVEKRKTELFKENKQIIDSANIEEYVKIEKTLLNQAEAELTAMDTPGINIYNSGASKGFGNNYKATSMARGAIPRSNNLSQMNISTTSLMQGIKKEDLWKYNDMLTIASFNRAIGTQIGKL